MIDGCDNLQEGSDGLSVTVGIAAAAGLGLLAFSEVRFLSPFSTVPLIIYIYIHTSKQLKLWVCHIFCR